MAPPERETASRPARVATSSNRGNSPAPPTAVASIRYSGGTLSGHVPAVMAARFRIQRARRSSGRNCRSERCQPIAALRAARAESETGPGGGRRDRGPAGGALDGRLDGACGGPRGGACDLGAEAQEGDPDEFFDGAAEAGEGLGRRAFQRLVDEDELFERGLGVPRVEEFPRGVRDADEHLRAVGRRRQVREVAEARRVELLIEQGVGRIGQGEQAGRHLARPVRGTGTGTGGTVGRLSATDGQRHGKQRHRERAPPPSAVDPSERRTRATAPCAPAAGSAAFMSLRLFSA